MRSDMEEWKEIRQQVLVNSMSQRAACEKYKLGWQTLKKILSHSEPPGYRQSQARPRRVLAPEATSFTSTANHFLIVHIEDLHLIVKYLSVRTLYGNIRRNATNTAK